MSTTPNESNTSLLENPGAPRWFQLVEVAEAENRVLDLKQAVARSEDDVDRYRRNTASERRNRRMLAFASILSCLLLGGMAAVLWPEGLGLLPMIVLGAIVGSGINAMLLPAVDRLDDRDLEPIDSRGREEMNNLAEQYHDIRQVVARWSRERRVVRNLDLQKVRAASYALRDLAKVRTELAREAALNAV